MELGGAKPQFLTVLADLKGLFTKEIYRGQ